MVSNELRAEMKDKALELMKELKIYKPYVNEFKKNDTITLFADYGGYYIDNYNKEYIKLNKIIKDLEDTYDLLVYAVIESYNESLDLYSYNLLIIPKYKNEWNTLVENIDIDDSIEINNKYLVGKHQYNVFSYVYNIKYPIYSELGTISVASALGGLRRLF